MGIKMTLTFENETMETLERKAREDGFVRPSIILARYLLLRGLKEDMNAEINDDRQVIHVAVNNYREIKDYVDEKQLGNINVFAAFAMKQYMTRYPLKTAAKRQDGKQVND
jgi:c-di-AMP phosphodiesterase-like protein